MYANGSEWECIDPSVIPEWGAGDAERAPEVLAELVRSACYYIANPDDALSLLAPGGSRSVVRVIYATPLDVEVNPVYMEALPTVYAHIQDWFAGKLEGLTFEVQAPIPQHCTLPQRGDYYAGHKDGYTRVIEDIQHCAPVSWGSPFFVWAIYVDTPFVCDVGALGAGGGGTTIMHGDDLEGLSNPNGHTQCGFPRTHMGYVGGTAHELGHAFGLPHPPGCDEGLDTCDQEAMMQWGYTVYPNTYLRDDDIANLKVSPFFWVQR